jgi:pectin methylesterase-like acyl-CoA thioesterase
MRRRTTRLESFRPLMAFVPAVAAAADVHTVDDDDPAADFATIQAAVDIAVDGDSILVGPGY